MDTKKGLSYMAMLALLLCSPLTLASDDDDDDHRHKHKRHKHHYKHHHDHEYDHRPVYVVPERYVYATVVSVEPIMERITHQIPHQNCWEEVHYERDRSSATGTILGGIVGGVVGNQFGDGRGKDAMTLAGTLLGGSIGNDMSQGSRNVRQVREERCRTHNEYREEQRVSGYHVTYRYRNHTHTIPMDHHPGQRVRVNVSVFVDD